LFLNTPIRPLQIKFVTPKWPVLGVEAVFFGKAGFGVGEKSQKIGGL
jgi:hypothetical protein